MRPDELGDAIASAFVSIHAPWEGCDLAMVIIALPCISFNSRTLGRVRLELSDLYRLLQEVSIHAPWEGCDLKAVTEHIKQAGFQFTHPGKGATTSRLTVVHTVNVSIHAPWEGCDYKVSRARHL